MGSQFEGQTCEVVNVDDSSIDDAQYSVKGRHPVEGMRCLWHPASSLLPVDVDGWIENTGVQPVADDVRVDIELDYGGQGLNKPASTWRWSLESGAGSNVVKWRFHQKAEEKPPEPPRVMRLSEQVALLETDKHTLEMIVEKLTEEVADLKSKLEAIRGLV